MKHRLVWRDGVPGWLREDGRFFPVIAGGDGTGDGGSSGADDSDADEDEDEDEEEDDNAGNKKEDIDKIKNPKAALAARDAANARLAKKIKRMDREAADKDKKIKEAEDAKKTDDQKVIDERDELKKTVETKDHEIAGLNVQIALLENDEVAALPSRRRALVIRLLKDELEIDEDGDSNLEDLLKTLKKEEPDLFKKASANGDDSDDEEEEPEPEKKSKSGTRTVGKKKKGKGIDQSEMVRRFPQLQGRVPAE